MRAAGAGDLLEEFGEGVLGADVEVDFGGLKTVVAEDLLQAGGADAPLHAIHGEAVPKRVRRDGLRDHRPDSDPLDDPLGRPRREADALVRAEVDFEEPLGPPGDRNHPPLALAAVRSALAPHDQAAFLPVNLVSSQVAELRHSQPRVEQHPDHELFVERRAGVDEPVALVIVQRLTDKLIGHDNNCRGCL